MLGLCCEKVVSTSQCLYYLRKEWEKINKYRYIINTPNQQTKKQFTNSSSLVHSKLLQKIDNSNISQLYVLTIWSSYLNSQFFYLDFKLSFQIVRFWSSLVLSTSPLQKNQITPNFLLKFYSNEHIKLVVCFADFPPKPNHLLNMTHLN